MRITTPRPSSTPRTHLILFILFIVTLIGCVFGLFTREFSDLFVVFNGFNVGFNVFDDASELECECNGGTTNTCGLASPTPAIVPNSTETGVQLRELNVIEYDLSTVSRAATVTTIGIENKNIIESDSLMPQITQTPYPTTATTINFNTTGVVSRESENLGCDLCGALTAPATVTTIVIDNENKYESEPNGPDTQTSHATSNPTVPGINTAFNFGTIRARKRGFNVLNNVFDAVLN